MSLFNHKLLLMEQLMEYNNWLYLFVFCNIHHWFYNIHRYPLSLPLFLMLLLPKTLFLILLLSILFCTLNSIFTSGSTKKWYLNFEYLFAHCVSTMFVYLYFCIYVRKLVIIIIIPLANGRLLYHTNSNIVGLTMC